MSPSVRLDTISPAGVRGQAEYQVTNGYMTEVIDETDAPTEPSPTRGSPSRGPNRATDTVTFKLTKGEEAVEVTPSSGG